MARRSTTTVPAPMLRTIDHFHRMKPMSSTFDLFLKRCAAALVCASPMLALAIDFDNNVPEPGSWMLVGVALVAAVAIGRRKRK